MAIDDVQQGTRLPLTVTEAATQLRSGDLTSVSLTSALIARADALYPVTGTYVTRFDDHALAQAEQADADFAGGIDKGPYQGIPIGIKDILAVAEGRTTFASRASSPRCPPASRPPNREEAHMDEMTEAMVRNALFAAGLSPSEEEIASLVESHADYRTGIESLYAVPEMRYASPALTFSATPVFADWST